MRPPRAVSAGRRDEREADRADRHGIDRHGADRQGDDRHDCPACHGTWIRIVTRDRTGIALRCVQCGCRFALAAQTT